jgi:predicted metalloprotease with PDZ domain
MWRGGLSGEDSFYMHADRPLRTPDGTSPYLHELFHVLAPFRPAADGHWVTEGLAEYYSLELQRRAGKLDAKAYARALRLFARYGRWDRDFTRGDEAAVRNNSAPLVMALLDRRLQAATAGARRLDTVVADLARDGGTVSTARFLGAVRRIGGRGFGAFFRRYVYRGERPDLAELGA